MRLPDNFWILQDSRWLLSVGPGSCYLWGSTIFNAGVCAV